MNRYGLVIGLLSMCCCAIVGCTDADCPKAGFFIGDCEPECGEGQEYYAGRCVDACQPNEFRSENGVCEDRCPPGAEYRNELCVCPEGTELLGQRGCVGSCSLTNGGVEQCDGLDNDCNGNIDEGFDVGRACIVGDDDCARPGEVTCSENPAQTACKILPSADPFPSETCDATDNDCDGSIDEGFGLGEICTVGLGQCAQEGERICGDDGTAICDALATEPEQEDAAVCNGLDDDCDGSVDEAARVGQNCVVGLGQCQRMGVIECTDVNAPVCVANPAPPSIEQEGVCNGLDDDCDGQIDETSYLGEACEIGQGRCLSIGEITCIQGQAQCFSEEGNQNVVQEQCNEIDDDCDGVVDEGFNVGGFCTIADEENDQCFLVGARFCAEDGTEECILSAGEARREVCDGLDNNCNGDIDEGFNLGENCQVGQGACAVAGHYECDVESQSHVCVPTEEPEILPEICDNIDNDCDGSVDEEFDVGEACEQQLEECVVQGVQMCDPEQPDRTQCQTEDPALQDEVCDGLDNNCNGDIDEGLGLGEPCQVGQGECSVEGSQVCGIQGQVTCDASPLPPKAEQCNDLDDDCDGSTDEGYNLGQECVSGLGECQTEGVIECTPIFDARCSADAEIPEGTDELCDSLDNDCDGSLDEDFQVGEPCTEGEGVCEANGVYECNDDFEQVCTAEVGEPLLEASAPCNSLDDDCDGLTDEFEEDERVCIEGTGACQAEGTKFCSPGGQIFCEANPTEPEIEVCNEVDDDCDGMVDEGFEVGQACRVGLGACLTEGQTVCAEPNPEDPEAELVTCSAIPAEPAEEESDGTCNEVDDDCDGIVDEESGVGEICSVIEGRCVPRGLYLCNEGRLSCLIDEEIPVGDPERCNNYDDDCDGTVDEGAECFANCPGGEEGQDAPCNRCAAGTNIESDAWVCIPRGVFWMGSRENEEGRDIDEVRHRVEITRDYFVTKTEVTKAQWIEVMGYDPTANYAYEENFPVTNITWFETLEFANQMSTQQGLQQCYTLENCRFEEIMDDNDRLENTYLCDSYQFVGVDCEGYRLPTEAEWEKAARAGFSGAYWSFASVYGFEHTGCGDNFSLQRIAWYCGTRDSEWGRLLKPVAQKDESPYGLYDVNGNAAEMVFDSWESFFSSDSIEDPDIPVIDPIGPEREDLDWRVERGGNYASISRYIRNAARSIQYPADPSTAVGFRLARTSPIP